jgi:uncharacterized protein (DUF2141 family)
MLSVRHLLMWFADSREPFAYTTGMKSLLAPLLLLFLMSGCDPAAAPPHQIATVSEKLAHLTVRVIDLRNDKGQLLFGVYDRANGFPCANALNHQTKSAATGDPVFEIDLPPGDYAASVLHDENSDGKMNTNIIGIPIEGYGVTNNPKPHRRAVRYSEAVFTLPAGGANLTISIQYDFY